jgi:hypothetical protein
MFIFITNQDLWTYELMGHITICDHFLGQKDILKFILLFHDPI